MAYQIATIAIGAFFALACAFALASLAISARRAWRHYSRIRRELEAMAKAPAPCAHCAGRRWNISR